MARALSPEAPAVRIMQAIADGSAKDAADAIRQTPALKPGLDALKKAVQTESKAAPHPVAIHRQWADHSASLMRHPAAN